MSDCTLRHLPSISALLLNESFQGLVTTLGRQSVRNGLRAVLAELRSELGASTDNGIESGQLISEIEQRLRIRLSHRDRARTLRVINATGVVLHTNLGRSPLSSRAIESIVEMAGGYSNLEYDLTTGERGKRGSGLESMLCELFGCQSAAVVNNCAAAVLIALNTLADGGEVIVSRGELIEIGGSFRIPDVIAKSGARLREVGTTNRTRLSDYEKAINADTRLILKAHPSNYRIVGFTESPSLEALCALAREKGLPLFEDLGSGSVLDLSGCGIKDEPTVADSLRSGVSLIAFSGDKLLGGPQAGLLLGHENLIDQIKRNPLMRALRVDKLTYAALEGTIASYLSGRAIEEIPTQAALHMEKVEIARRARRFLRRAKRQGIEARLSLIDGFSVVGGGSAPETGLPTVLIKVAAGGKSADDLAAHLRSCSLPVIARILDDQLVIDLRTVAESEESGLLQALSTAQLLTRSS